MERLLIKGKFICFEKEFYGLFILYLDLESKKENLQVAAGGSSFISTYSVETPGEKFLAIIEELLEDEEASLVKSREMKALILSQASLIRDTVLKKDVGGLENYFRDLLKNFLKAPVELALSSEKVDSFDLRDVEQERTEKNQKEKEAEERLKYKIPTGAEVVECFAVLSPIKGKPIKDIQEGDLVLSKIDDSTEQGSRIAENYQLYSEGKKIKPVIGKVYRKFHEGNEMILILNLGKNLVGFAREDESVKITFIEPDKIVSKTEVRNREVKKQAVSEKKAEVKKEQLKSEMTVYLLVGILVIVLALVLLLFS